MASGTVMKQSAVSDESVPETTDDVYAAQTSEIDRQTRKILLLIGASVALSLTATGVALVIANRGAVSERLRQTSARTSRGFTRLTRTCGDSVRQLTAKVSHR